MTTVAQADSVSITKPLVTRDRSSKAERLCIDGRSPVAVVDVMWIGSLPTYHLAVVKSLIDLGCRVVSFSPRPEWVLLSIGEDAKSRGQLAVEKIGAARTTAEPTIGVVSRSEKIRARIPGWLLAAMRARRKLRLAAQVWGEVRFKLSSYLWTDGTPVGHVFFPYLDFPVITLLRNRKPAFFDLDRAWSGLWICADTPGRQSDGVSSVSHVLKSLPNFRGFWSLEEDLVRDDETVLDRVWFGPMPDMTDEELRDEPGLLERDVIQVGQDGPIVLLVGELSARKGIYELLEVARSAERQGSHLRFMIAGPLDASSSPPGELADLNEALRDAPDNVTFRRGSIPDGHEFNAAIRGSAVLWVAYRDFPHSSNLLTKAALIGRPVVASANGLIGDRVRRFRLGAIISPSDPDASVAVLEQLASEKVRNMRRRHDRMRYFEKHSCRKLSEIFAAALGREDSNLDESGVLSGGTDGRDALHEMRDIEPKRGPCID